VSVQTGFVTRRALLAVLAVMALLLLGACSGSGNSAGTTSGSGSGKSAGTTSGSASSPPTSTPSASGSSSSGSPSASPANGKGVAPKPRAGDCYNVTAKQFQRQRDGSRPVPCSHLHTAETFAVIAASPYPKRNVINQAWRNCQIRFAVYIGNTTTVSTLGLTLMLPSQAQIAQGQHWIRCDAIQTPYYNATVGEPLHGTLHDALRGHVPQGYRGCARRWPKSGSRVHFSSCAHKHQAELIPVAKNLGGPSAPYPGTKKVRKQSKQFCARVFQHYVPQTRHYYFYYPTAGSWRSGSHATTCWAVDRTGPNLPPVTGSGR
jgi:Septum formation